MFILGTFIMCEYVKGMTCQAAWFPGHSRVLSLYEYLYIDKEYIIFILGTFTMCEYVKKSKVQPLGPDHHLPAVQVGNAALVTVAKSGQQVRVHRSRHHFDVAGSIVAPLCCRTG